MKGLIFTLVMLTLFLSLKAQDNTKNERKLSKEEKQAEQIKKVTELIENKSFVFSARQAVPLCGDPVSLDDYFSMNINEGIINCYLPFYGFESDYKIENSPLVFTNTIDDYAVTQENDKNIITFNVPLENDNMKFYLRISKLGYTYLKITSTQRQNISFLGIIDEIEATAF